MEQPSTLRSLIRIRSGWLILPMFVLRDASSMSACSWMFSPESRGRSGTPISDAQTATTGIEASLNSSFRSRRAVSFKGLYYHARRTSLRFPSPNADALGRMDMPKDSFAPSKRKKLTSMTIKASPRPEIASDILSHRCIIRNAHTRR